MKESRISACAAALIVALATPLAAQQRTALPARDNVLPGTPADVYTVGKEEGEAYELFASIAAVGFDAQDNLYVLDRGNHRVVVFDARGRYVRTVGRRGEGPGEFTLPGSMSVAADGSVIVSDLARTSLSLFDPAGSYRSIPLPAGGARPAGGSPMFWDANGVVVRTMDLDPEALARGGATMNTSITRYAPIGDQPRARSLFEIPQPAPTVSSPQPGRTMISMSPPIFTPQPFWGLLPDGGVAVAHEPTYTIRLTDANGRVQRIIERAIEPRRVTREDRERALEQRAAARASGNVQTVRIGGGGAVVGGSAPAPSRSDVAQMLGNTEFADVVPVISQFRVDGTGRIWVGRSGRRVGEPGPVDLLAPDGRYIGTLNGQSSIPDAVSRSGMAAYIVTDDLGIARVAVRRLPENWRP